MKHSHTNIIIGALQILARDIHTDDGVANACLIEAAERLQSLSAEVERLCAERRWIPVEERVPEVGKYFLACHSLHRSVWIQSYHKNGVWIGLKPTHWMPLPELPQKVQV